MKNLVTTEWLEKNINSVKILDGSWHMPSSKRNGFEEFKRCHIPNSIFIDLDKTSNKKSPFPHMLPEKKDWEKSVSELGIHNSDHIIVYDNSDVISSCRIWYNFLYFNHNILKISSPSFKLNNISFTCFYNIRNVSAAGACCNISIIYG